MSARLGAGAQLGLGEALLAGAPHPLLKFALGALVVLALGVGNAAYEGGNLSGGALGLEAIIGEAASPQLLSQIVMAISLVAAALLLLGGYRFIEKVLVCLVVLMALAFAISAVLVRPDLAAFAAGLVPHIPENGLFTAIALIGTTIVPFNLFLHAAAAKSRWNKTDDASVEAAQSDTYLSVGLGGLISILILSTAASSLVGHNAGISNAVDMAAAIEPTYGAFARYLVGFGLLAAGVSSAVTAPMATAYAVCEIVKLADRRKSETLFKGIALLILLVGTIVAVSGVLPTQIIFVAQIANGLLLPVIAGSLLFAMNQKTLLGHHVNGLLSNILGIGVVLITLLMGVRGIGLATGFWP
ncbi:NRAMP family divalent metal transporter [Ponticaulis sp.]|uniref:NRAMP family divalent metal transporter n=1 Tax=Ponticaulis sp. TaxID=2020902 RepID=UPI0025CBC5F5|nr:divalent metal cation transporter [Ponticaulis sp.]|tara:strand:- start:157070 stop:158140 length:1071 start_codon:yes stop_codon:yes gene_type:complete